MAYKHGVYTSEVETSLIAPITGTAGPVSYTHLTLPTKSSV